MGTPVGGGTEVSPAWGAVILTTGFSENFWQMNSGGCYAAEGANEHACAEALEQTLQCDFAVCEPDDNPNGVFGNAHPPFNSCRAAVEAHSSGACGCYADSAEAACAAFASSPCALPLGGPGGFGPAWDTAFKRIAQIMCE